MDGRSQIAKVWRDCSVCLEPVSDHDSYYHHVKDQHPTALISQEVREHYIAQVTTEFFIGQDVQPIQ